ncbi:hypothetical protein H4218_001972 [Coemansia sp. IMI 209128]|nr:hypothetical protein H4218_001972 [Coemansia sp. IMI 209128]
MSDSREAAPQQAPPQQVAPQMVVPPNAKCASKARRQCVILIVLSLLTFLANLGLCAYYTYMALSRGSRYYYYGGSSYYYSYNTSFYTWRAGLCGAVALISLCTLIFAIVKLRRTKKKLMDPNQYMTQGVTYVYQGNNAPVFYPPPGAQWQQQPQQGYAGMPYPQPAYGPLPPGQQPIQYPQPMQHQQQPVSPAQV